MASPALRCPDKAAIVPKLIALLPRGRAWKTNEGGPEPTSTIYRFWASYADVLAWLNGRICALALEFFCATQNETHEQWMTEYGLPDACDPFPDLCTKVSAIGGTRCEYYTALATRLGWVIDCDSVTGCGSSVGCAEVGKMFPGDGIAGAKLRITVDLGQSEAYARGAISQSPFVGCFEVGNSLGCGPDITALRCLLDRVVHAEVDLSYVTVGPEIYLADEDGAVLADLDGALLTEGT